LRHGSSIGPGYGGTGYENTALRHAAKQCAQAGEEQGYAETKAGLDD